MKFFTSAVKSEQFRPRLSKEGDAPPPEIFQLMESTPPVTPTSSQRKTVKKVSFDSTVHVVLIPSIVEYKEAKLFGSLWYSRKELNYIEKTGIVTISTGKLFDETEDFWSFLPHI
jgi:hypothetical protein